MWQGNELRRFFWKCFPGAIWIFLIIESHVGDAIRYPSLVWRHSFIPIEAPRAHGVAVKGRVSDQLGRNMRSCVRPFQVVEETGVTNAAHAHLHALNAAISVMHWGIAWQALTLNAISTL